MQTFTFGDWVIEADVEATRAYYQQFDEELANHQLPVDRFAGELTTAEENKRHEATLQAYRNYKEFCKTLTEEEMEFFDTLGINPESVCQFGSLGLDKNGTVFSSGNYHIIGKYAGTPDKLAITVEELADNDFIDDRPDANIYVGRYEFAPNRSEEEIEYDYLPEILHGAVIQLNFTIENTPWLLDEECIEQRYYPPKWWELSKKIAQKAKWKIMDAEHLVSIEKHVQYLIGECSWKKLSNKETNQLCEKWFKKFVPNDKQKEARKVCFDTGRLINHLWHTFSFEWLPCLESNAAREAFDNIDKGGSIYILQQHVVGKQHVAYYIESPIQLKSTDFDDIDDIYIFDKDFSFTYVHTHEDSMGLGPYFYQKN